MRFLFVYGTLRPAVELARIRHLVERLKLVGSGRMPGRLVYLGSYPGAVVDPAAAGFIAGEVMELGDAALLAEIDAYEGFDPARPEDGEYTRALRTVELDGTGPVECWIYELRAVPAHAEPIECGDFIAWLSQRRAD